MRHRRTVPKLGRTASHRDAMLRTMVTDLLRHEKIRTTTTKAKALRPLAERMITLGKRETLHARRHAARVIRDKTVVKKLFDDLAPRYAERPGGYTRILKLAQREGDRAEMAIIELVEAEIGKKKRRKRKKRGGPRTAAQDTAAAAAAAQAAEAEDAAETETEDAEAVQAAVDDSAEPAAAADEGDEPESENEETDDKA